MIIDIGSVCKAFKMNLSLMYKEGLIDLGLGLFDILLEIQADLRSADLQEGESKRSG
jgi:hypothetical protein